MALKPGQPGFQGAIGNQYVGQQMWDPRGFYVIPNYGGAGQNLHVYPDGRKTLVKNPGAAASATTGIVTPAAKSAAATPAAAAGAGGGASPPDATYDADVLAAGKTRDTTVGTLGQERTRGLQGYGYTEDFKFDPTDPYSRAALLKQTYDASRRSTGLQMGAAGQMNTGAYQTSQDALNRKQLQGEDTLQKSLTQWLGENNAAKAAAESAYGTALSTAETNKYNRAVGAPIG